MISDNIKLIIKLCVQSLPRCLNTAMAKKLVYQLSPRNALDFSEAHFCPLY